jgi:hypothetical protein
MLNSSLSLAYTGKPCDPRHTVLLELTDIGKCSSKYLAHQASGLCTRAPAQTIAMSAFTCLASRRDLNVGSIHVNQTSVGS